MLLGLRPDSDMVAENWPKKPKNRIAVSNMRICHVMALCTMIFLWFLTAFRAANIGNDTSAYIYYFNIFANNGIDTSRSFEIGYQILNVLIGKFTTDPHIFIIIIATIMYAATTLYIYKYSKNILISVCLFYCAFFSFYTSIFRQGIAMIIVLFAYQELKNNKRLIAVVLFLIATLFHTSAIVCFFLFLDIRLLKKRWLIFIITLLCAIASASGLFNTILSAILPRYTHYFASQYTSTGWLAVSYELVRSIVFYALISFASDENSHEERLTITNFVLLLIFSAFGYSVNLFTRAGAYFFLIAITELPNTLYNGKVKHFKFWLFGICTILLFMFIFTLIYRPEWNHLYPYEFWR